MDLTSDLFSGQQLDQQALMVGQLDFSISSGFLGFAMPPLGEMGRGEVRHCICWLIFGEVLCLLFQAGGFKEFQFFLDRLRIMILNFLPAVSNYDE